MSYAICLDNSWDVMCEEEMYDVNGGWTWKNTVACIGIGVAAIFVGVGITIATGGLGMPAYVYFTVGALSAAGGSGGYAIGVWAG